MSKVRKEATEANNIQIKHKIKPMPSAGTLNCKRMFVQKGARNKSRLTFKNLIEKKVRERREELQRQTAENQLMFSGTQVRAPIADKKVSDIEITTPVDSDEEFKSAIKKSYNRNFKQDQKYLQNIEKYRNKVNVMNVVSKSALSNKLKQYNKFGDQAHAETKMRQSIKHENTIVA